MTKRKPDAVRGRPKGSGAAFDQAVSVRLPEWVVAELEIEAAKRGGRRSGVLRRLAMTWAVRQAKDRASPIIVSKKAGGRR